MTVNSFRQVSRTWLALIIIVAMFWPQAGFAQQPIKRSAFFTDTSTLEMELTTDLRTLLNKKPNEEYVVSSVVLRLPGGNELKADTVGVRTRGNYRRENCELASLMFQFNYNKEHKTDLSSLKRVKFVAACRRGAEVDQLVLKEFLTYRIYQLYTPMSFRVRMVRTKFTDKDNKVKSYWQYGFFIEDVDDLADRNDMVEKYNHGFMTEQTNRHHTTLVAIFQYMIGNTDWAIPVDHNIKLLAPKADTMQLPFVVPYDFDYCGLVNADYAIPHETLEIDDVRTRLYRGFPRTLDELKPIIEQFNANKDATFQMIENFELLSKPTKKLMVKYLEEFYKEISTDKGIENAFIKEARLQ